MGFLNKLFGSHSDRELKKIQPIVDKILALEEPYRQLDDEALKAKTGEFRQRLEAGETLDDLLPEAFAAIREAADRVLGMRPYPVQLIGGIVLHQGRIAEMKTGEGKTLVAILPAYLNALTGKGVHIVTVNDYLAKRDSEWMGKVYRFMGLEVGLIIHGKNANERRAAYAADITYCTNNELGFDYLRDNMAIYKTEMVQRGHNFAIVDEVDSILIDEARTPLIISGRGEASTKLYEMADALVSRMKKQVFASVDTKEVQDDLDCDYIVDEKAKTATLTASGIAKAEQFFGIENLSDPENSTLSHHVNQALKARGVMQRDIDYVVKDGQVIIVDEFTGRLMYGRRYSDGLHQAIEAKEYVKVENESKTLATITFQNFFRLYPKLSGMTGTALTEQEEFSTIYSLDVVEIPTNRPVARLDDPDVVYKTQNGKYRAVIAQVKQCHEKGQPVLVGTISIEKSELLSHMLKKEGIPHTVLNAKQHEKEAEIVAQAGRTGMVTIATNMAGRGTDIVLGGNPEYMAKNDLRKKGMEERLIVESNSFAETEDPEILAARAAYNEAYERYKQETDREAEKVRAAGGLFIIGTERHESRRIDNQLRGRAGRQGDPGETRFYLSMEDDIMRLFGAERIMNMMDTLKIDEDTPIDQKILSNAIESAQKKVESVHFQQRKNVLEYDDVMNTQRKVIYEQRQKVLDGDQKILSNAIESAQKKVESVHFQQRKNVLEYDDVMNTQRKVIYEQRQKVLDGDDLQSSIHSMLEGVIDEAVNAALGEHDYLSDREQLEHLLKPFEGVYFAEGAFGEADLEDLTKQALKDRILKLAEQTYAAKEQELGSPIMRELERVITLRVVDEYWMEQIDSMQDLRQGIVLRAYGQNNPVIEYKREGYEMFSQISNTSARAMRCFPR